jgi:transposase
MNKFTRTERLKAVLAVEAGDSIANIAKQLGMSKTGVARNVNIYREQGEAGFQQKKKASYTAAQKLEILGSMYSQGMSHEAAAVKFGMNGSGSIWKWEQEYLKNGIEGLQPKKQGRRPKVPKPKAPLTPYEQLLAENEYLRAENEYLKKLNALVAEREAREKHDDTTE